MVSHIDTPYCCPLSVVIAARCMDVRSDGLHRSAGMRGHGPVWAGSDNRRKQQIPDLRCMGQAGPVNQSLGKHFRAGRLQHLNECNDGSRNNRCETPIPRPK